MPNYISKWVTTSGTLPLRDENTYTKAEVDSKVNTEIPAAVDDWMDNNVQIPSGTAIALDSSLTLNTAAAPAGVVGTKLSAFNKIGLDIVDGEFVISPVTSV